MTEAEANAAAAPRILRTACDKRSGKRGGHGPPPYTAEVQTATANLQAANWSVETAQEQARLSDANASRFTNLANEGVVTERERDEYVTAGKKDDRPTAKRDSECQYRQCPGGRQAGRSGALDGQSQCRQSHPGGVQAGRPAALDGPGSVFQRRSSVRTNPGHRGNADWNQPGHASASPWGKKPRRKESCEKH